VLAVCCIIYIFLAHPTPQSQEQLPAVVEKITQEEDAVSDIKGPIKSPSDPNEYRVFNLSNKLEVMIISDPTTHLSAAAIDFGVGDYQDFFTDEDGNEIGARGLAHFHEHMVFLGTKEFPGEDVFDHELAKHHGGADADTSDQDTNFRIWVQNDGLPKAMEMWASHFKNPLFAQDKIDKEVHQVHAEYLEDKPREGERQFEMVKVSANPKHPIHRFNVGTIKTLKVPHIHSMLVKFHKKYFSSHIAKLCVYTHLSLDDAQKLVRKTFGGISHKKIPYPEVDKDIPAFTKDQLMKNYVIESSSNKDTLSISWPLPSDTYYKMRVPAIDWITNQVEYKGPGGLYDVLIRKGLASWVSTEETCRDRSVEIFSFIIVLTEEGLWKTPIVVGLILDYMKLMLKKSLEQWRFDEYQELDALAWRYYKRPDTLDSYVRDIAEQMHFNEPQDMLYPNFRAPPERYVWDKDFLRRILESFTASNMISYLFTAHHDFSKYEGKISEEKWFGIKYMKDDIKKEYIDKWDSEEISDELSLPPPNIWKMNDGKETSLNFTVGPCAIKYMPNSGRVTAVKEGGPADKMGVDPGWTIKSIDGEPFTRTLMDEAKERNRTIVFSHPVEPYPKPDGWQDNSPQSIWDFSEAPTRAWWSYDTRKKAPRVWTSISFKNPNLDTCAENFAKTKLFQKIAQYQFNLGYGQAREGGYHLDMNVGHGGSIEWRFHGYNLHMRKLVNEYISDVFNSTIDASAFKSLTVNLRNSIANDVQGVAHFQTWNWFLQVVAANVIPLTAQMAILDKITQDEYNEFVKYLRDNIDVRLFVFGNVDEAYVKDMMGSLTSIVNPSYVEAINETHSNHKEIPYGLNIVQYENQNKEDDNDAVDLFWQINPGGSDSSYYYTISIMEIIVSIMRQKAFDVLRTQQHLGYTCQTRVENFGFVLYLRIDIQGPSHDATQILEAILKFVDDFYKDTIKPMKQEKFDRLKEAQAAKYSKKDATQAETNDDYWIDLKSDSSAFDNDEHMKNMAGRVVLSDFKDFYLNNFLSDESRILGVQLFSQGTDFKRPKTKHKLLDNTTMLEESGYVETSYYASSETSVAGVAERRVGHRPHSPLYLTEIQ